MKIGILMAGISYGYKSDRDFRHCFPNINKNLIQPLKNNHDVEVYVTTYHHEYMLELQDLFKPVDIKILPYEGNTQLTTRKESFLQADKDHLDFFIMSRFDLHFNQPLSNFNLDFNKFNIVSREGKGFWESERFVGDVLFAWPKFLQDGVRKTFQDLLQATSSRDWRHEGKHNHNFYIHLSPNIGEENIHFMFNNYQLSGHEFASICTEDCSRRLRGQYLVNEEVIARFP